MSKLNPQKASAYVGPGVLKQGGKTTPVPNGPLIKKKGPYAGSTLKSGGKVKKGQEGTKIGKLTLTTSTKDTIKDNSKYPGIRPPRIPIGGGKTDEGISNVKKLLKSKAQNGAKTKKAQFGGLMSMFGGKDNPIYKKTTAMRGKLGSAALGIPGMKPIAKNGKDMIKRADGSYSKRGLWDNIRANKGSGKKPTKQMLQQEKKIKAKTKK